MAGQNKNNYPFISKVKQRLSDPCPPEKIIFCLDICPEAKGTELQKSCERVGVVPGDPTVTGLNYTRLEACKQVVRNIIHTKSRMNPGNEFMLMAATDTCIPMTEETTSDTNLLLSALDDISTAEQDVGSLNVASLFEYIDETVGLPSDNGSEVSHVVRVIFLYCRSGQTPKYSQDSLGLRNCFQNEYFYFDVMFLHSTPGEDNDPQMVYDSLTVLGDQRPDGNSYVFEDSVNYRRVCTHAAQLCAHPMQRLEQTKDNATLPDMQTQAGGETAAK